MPFMRLLVCSGGAEERGLFERLAQELQADRKTAGCESTRYGYPRETGEVGADRVNIGKIHRQRIRCPLASLERGHRRGRREDDIHVLEGLEEVVADLEARVHRQRRHVGIAENGLAEQLQQHFVQQAHVHGRAVIALHELFDRQVGGNVTEPEAAGDFALVIEQQAVLGPAGQQVQVQVIRFNPETQRISLGMKQLEADPWEGVSAKYPVGTKFTGRVTNITDYGAFVELEKGVEGLVHISEMSWTRHIKHPSKVVSIGDLIEAVVLNVNEEEEKISLGMKQIEEDPWDTLAEKYPPGTIVAGKVRNLTSFGAFVEIEEGIDGLVHISDMSWTRRIHHPSEVVRKGETVKVQVLHIDTENKRISLSIKDLEENPWTGLAEKYSAGVEASGKVVRLLDKGVVVDLEGEVEGFVPISQLGYRNLENPADKFREGDLLELKVIESDPDNRRIVLSVTDIPSHRERGELPEEEPVHQHEPEPEPPSRPERERPPTQMADALAEARSEMAGESEETEE